MPFLRQFYLIGILLIGLIIYFISPLVGHFLEEQGESATINRDD